MLNNDDLDAIASITEALTDLDETVDRLRLPRTVVPGQGWRVTWAFTSDDGETVSTLSDPVVCWIGVDPVIVGSGGRLEEGPKNTEWCIAYYRGPDDEDSDASWETYARKALEAQLRNAAEASA